MKKEKAELLASSKEIKEIIGKHFILLPGDIEHKVESVNVKQINGSQVNYDVFVTVTNLSVLSKPKYELGYFEFNNNYYRMRFEDKLRLLYNKADFLLKGIQSDVNLGNPINVGSFTRAIIDLSRETLEERYREWQNAHKEYSNLLNNVIRQDIDVKREWLQ